MGKTASDGMLFFLLTERIDAEAVFENDPTSDPPGQTTIGVTAKDLRDRDRDGVGPDHRGSFRIIALNPNSGSVTVSPVDLTDELTYNKSTNNWSPGPDGWADNIFNLALQGAEVK